MSCKGEAYAAVVVEQQQRRSEDSHDDYFSRAKATN